MEPLKILVVDDEPPLREILQRSLTQMGGFSVEVAQNGLEAIEKVEKDIFDLILTDLMMPAMDGMELLKMIKEWHWGAHLQLSIQTTLFFHLSSIVHLPPTPAYQRTCSAGRPAPTLPNQGRGRDCQLNGYLLICEKQGEMAQDYRDRGGISPKSP